MFEQLGEHRLEAAVTTDICGKNDSHAVRLDNEAIEAIKKARLHRKVATTIFFESNGGMTRAEASAPEIRLAVAETIARGVSNGQIAYVGKAGNGKYLPFNFERTIAAFDVEISEEMYIISKETADAYRARAAQPAASPASQPSIPGIEATAGANPPPTLASPGSAASGPMTPSGAKEPPGPTQLPLELTWSGEVPSQKWMNFYTKFLTKLGVGDGLSLNVSVKCAPKGGLSQQKVEEIKGALRELGLDDTFGGR